MAWGGLLSRERRDGDRASNYGYSRGKLLVCVVPDALQGPQQLVVQRLIYGTLRAGIYSQALEPSSP